MNIFYCNSGYVPSTKILRYALGRFFLLSPNFIQLGRIRLDIGYWYERNAIPRALATKLDNCLIWNGARMGKPYKLGYGPPYDEVYENFVVYPNYFF